MPTGTLILPPPSDVRAGVGYGADGTELTGTLMVAAPSGTAQGLALSHGVDDIIAQMLIDRGFGTDPTWWETHGVGDVTDTSHDWPVQSGSQPPQPDGTITVYETTPVVHGKEMLGGEQFQHYGFTVRVRAGTKLAARAKADAIRIDLNGNVLNALVVLDGVRYLVQSVSRTSLLPFGMEDGKSKRWLVNVNCLAVVMPLPISN